MSLLDTASLIVTPNAVKEGKLYSVIPSDGSGDLSVVRATTATRVNSAGLVELVPYNLLTYSQDFTNADWIKDLNNGSFATNATAPDGTTTAQTLTAGSGNFGYCYRFVTNSSGSVYAFSFYAKKGTANFAWMQTTSSSASYVNLTTLAVSAASGVTITATNVGNGWVRIVGVSTASSSSHLFAIGGSNASGSASMTSGTTIEVWGAQLVEGSTAKDYQKTETRLNIPRLDYSNGTCPSLLVEPQRTNFTRNNNNLSGWVETIPADTITLNAGISPDGNSNAIKIIPSTTYGAHMIYDDTTNASSGGNFTMSCYAKASGYSKIGLRESASVGYYATFNLANGTIIDNGGNNASIVDMGNGWYRCIVSVAFSGNVNMGIIALDDAYTSGQPYFPYEFAGNGTSGVLIYGPQLETSASYATSLISTAGVSSATRNADVISKTGISSLFGTNQGTFFLDLFYNNSINPDYLFDVTDSTNTNRFLMYAESGNTDLFVIYDSVSGNFSNYQLTKGERYKIAVKYNSTATYWYINGSLVATGNYGFGFQMSQIYLAQRYSLNEQSNVNINAAALWPTALTNTQLAQLTSI